MATWPATLPPLTQVFGFVDSPGDQTLRTQMDEGPDKTRRLPAPETDKLQFQQLLTTAQTLIMDTFYETTLAGGSLSFDSTQPRTGVTRFFKFVGRPTYSHRSAMNWTANIQLEVLP